MSNAAPSLEIRPLGFWHTFRNLAFFAAGTVLGYVIFESVLFPIPAHYLVLNTFLWMFARIALRRKPAFPYLEVDPNLLAWRSSISNYVILYALTQFAYWYLFWIGVTALLPARDEVGFAHHGGATASALALGVLSFVFVLGPALTRKYLSPHKRLPWILILIPGFILIVAVLLIKLDTSFDAINSISDIPTVAQQWWRDQLDAATRQEWRDLSSVVHPVLCLIGAVIAEGFADRIAYRLNHDINEIKGPDELIDTYEADYPTCIIRDSHSRTVLAATRHNLDRSTSADLARLYILIAFPMAIVLAFIHAPFLPARVPSPGQVAWFVFWLAILGFVGSSAKLWFIVPLQGRGLSTAVVQPVFAARLILLLVLSGVWVGLFTYLGRCGWCELLQKTPSASATLCQFRLPQIWGGSVLGLVDLSLLPRIGDTYFLGQTLAICTAAIVWIYLWRRGLLTDTDNIVARTERLRIQATHNARQWPSHEEEALIRFCRTRPRTYTPHIEHRANGHLTATWRDRNDREIELYFLDDKRAHFIISHGQNRIEGASELDLIDELIRGTGLRSVMGW